MSIKVWLTIVSCSALFYAGYADDTECSGHGSKVAGSSTCTCTNPRPDVGQLGWTGPDCQIPVFGAAADGRDLTDGCRQEHKCDSLEPDHWFCYNIKLPWEGPSDPWNYLTVQLARTSDDNEGDPDLYGLWYGGDKPDAYPDTTTFGYDFRETSAGSHAVVVKSIAKTSFGTDKNYTGVYVCIKAYGLASLKYSARAISTRCPGSFSAEGQPMICSSPMDAPDSDKRYSECTQDGKCVCKAPYAKPLEEVYEGLGFEDCSARIIQVPDSELTQQRPYLKEHENVPAKGWAFYTFNVTQDDYQVVVNVAGEQDSPCGDTGYYELYLKYGQPPGWRYGEWDFRPTWDYYTESDADLEVRFDQQTEGFQTGNWYAGVNGDDREACTYTITINKYDCPFNCNGRGSCVHESNGTRTCNCNEGYFGFACANEAASLQYSQPVTKEEFAFEYDYFELPTITEAQLKNNVELKVEASFTSEEGYGEWVSARPELLLLLGDVSSQPTTGNYSYKQVMEKQGDTYSIQLCPSQLSKGTWRAAIYNPMRIYKLGYTIKLSKQANCLNDCSGHGDCTEDGFCKCHDDWAGGDCSIQPLEPCQQGSRKPVDRHGQQGKCWQQCECDSAGKNCKYTDKCVTFNATDFDITDAACPAGYYLEGVNKSSSADVYVGGQCIAIPQPHRQGMAGWAVALWVILSLFSGAFVGCSLLWAHESGALSNLVEYLSRRQGRDGTLNQSLYHELSMDTGF